MTDHTVAKIIEDHNLDWQSVSGGRFELANIHSHAAVAVDIDDKPVALCKLGADCGGQTEAHRAHAAGCQPQSRFFEIEILRRPHLVLANAS